jgi:broad specificity phosphatase PhoE
VRFLLAKHALPVVDPSAPASTWVLGDEGRAGAELLGTTVRAFGATRVVSSTEPKAAETATIAASVLGVDVAGAYDGLREHRRESAGYLGDQEFDAAARALFATPDEPVWGEETGTQAMERFAAVLEDVVTDGTLVVAHGTVISLWCAAHCGVDGYELWKQLRTPSYVVINDARVETVIARVMC